MSQISPFIDSLDLDAYFKEYNPEQCKVGIQYMLEAASKTGPSIYMEIGCAHLATFRLFSSMLPSSGLAIGIDVRRYEPWDNFQPESGCKFQLVKDIPERQETASRIKKILGGRSIDILFIDGDHSYAAVKLDWDLYSPLVRSRGLIMIHDYNRNAPLSSDLRGEGAYFLCEDLKEQG